MIEPLLCLAIALTDVDGPIHCATGEQLRLRGIGGLELDGSRRGDQPVVPGNPYEQRRRLALAMGAEIALDERGPGRKRLWFSQPILLTCRIDGRSYARSNAWCSLPSGEDVSCLAIRIGVAARWDSYDRDRRLIHCQPGSR